LFDGWQSFTATFFPELFTQPPLSLEEIQGGDASAPILPDTTSKARSSSYGSKI